MDKKSPKFWVPLIVLFGLGWGLGYYQFAPQGKSSNVNLIRENSGQYQFVNPILIIDNSAIKFPEYDSMRDDIQSEISDLESNGSASDISVYFRNLNTGHWTGVNEDELYAPSSMLKLITLLAYLKMAESNPDLLQDRIYFADKQDPGQHYKPDNLLTPGSYSLRELLVQMIVESDNAAMEALNGLHPDEVRNVYKELALPDPSTPADDFMSAEMYSRVFRTLYSSTYLDRAYSEEALKLLSLTHFTSGIQKGVGTTIVSNKFGEHTLDDINGNPLKRELHDCGIVYYPDKPYFLCVMTKGNDFNKLEEVLQKISAVIYKDVEKTK